MFVSVSKFLIEGQRMAKVQARKLMFGGCLRGIKRVSGRSLEGFWKISGRSLRVPALRVSWRFVNVSVYRKGSKAKTFVSP